MPSPHQPPEDPAESDVLFGTHWSYGPPLTAEKIAELQQQIREWLDRYGVDETQVMQHRSLPEDLWRNRRAHEPRALDPVDLMDRRDRWDPAYFRRETMGQWPDGVDLNRKVTCPWCRGHQVNRSESGTCWLCDGAGEITYGKEVSYKDDLEWQRRQDERFARERFAERSRHYREGR